MKRVKLTQSVFEGKRTFEAGEVAEVEDAFAAKVVERGCGAYEEPVAVTANDTAAIAATEVKE